MKSRGLINTQICHTKGQHCSALVGVELVRESFFKKDEHHHAHKHSTILTICRMLCGKCVRDALTDSEFHLSQIFKRILEAPQYLLSKLHLCLGWYVGVIRVNHIHFFVDD